MFLLCFEQKDVSFEGYGYGKECLELFRGLDPGARALIEKAGLRRFVEIWKGEYKVRHNVVSAIAERFWDTTNTVHLKDGEATMTPLDFSALTGLEMGGDPIPYDPSLARDREALRWFLGCELPVENDSVQSHYLVSEFAKDKEKGVLSPEEIAQQARRYVIHLFGTTIFANRRGRCCLTYLPALIDMGNFGRFCWGDAGLSACYAYMGSFARGRDRSLGGAWRIWEVSILSFFPLLCFVFN